MKKNFKQKINHIIDRLNFKFNYFIANTIMKSKVDNGNNYFKIMSDEKLVDLIVNEKKSFSRFGDGELSLMLENRFDLNFQHNSEKLKEKLAEVLHSNESNLLIGINISFNDPSIYNKKVQKNCRTFNYLYRDLYKKVIPNEKEYGNSSITRFYIDYDNTDMDGAKKRVANLKRIWDNRDLLIVEGIHTRLGVGNDLFVNSNSIRRILVPETNAFDKYNIILSKVKNRYKENDLVLIAAGPTATVLAYDLAKNNIQAVDVGHIDVEYEWMNMNTKKRVAIKGKYVNEIKGKKYLESFEKNEEYKNSIIEVVD